MAKPRFARRLLRNGARATSVPALLLLLSLILLFFHRLAFGNMILARGDTFLYFYPYWEAAAAALRQGRVPLWNPNLFMGAPLLANSQVGFFYPLNWPFWLLLPTPYAVGGSILLHLFIAAVGSYTLGRRALALSRPAALLAALLFALGGYLTAQVEHVNQLQGLAWLPWLLLVVAGQHEGEGQRPWWVVAVKKGAAIGLLFALQLLAGHTQTVFIAGVALLIWIAASRLAPISDPAPGRPALRSLLALAAGVLLALLLAAVQLLPTVELAQNSARAGGLALNEVLSFSLHPLLLGAALLPGYGEGLFSEYVAFLPLTALLLALAGAWQWRLPHPHRPARMAALLLAGTGLFLALGRFNLLYLLLGRLPGFNLFRAPARWLVLYALGAALLAGVGLDLIRQGAGNADPLWPRVRRPLLLGSLGLALLGLWRFLAVPLAQVIPVGGEVVVEAPSLLTLSGWLLELLLLFLLLWWGGRPARRHPSASRGLRLVSLAMLALFLASRSQPYNQLTAPQAYFSLRPPVARLQALGDCRLLPDTCRRPPGRLLSLSQIFFDPGDLAEIESIYGDRLSPEGLYDYVIAVKHKEVLSPNLPLAYDLFSVDGFDGGILPLDAYTRLTGALLPAGSESTDGRLREYLDAVPEPRWLDLFNARYLLTDKVGDRWRAVGEQNTFFDLQHPVRVQPGETVSIGYLPPYEATGLWLLAKGEPGTVLVRAESEPLGTELLPEQIDDGLWQVRFPEPLRPGTLYLQAGETPWRLQGLALIDARDQTFQPLVPGNYRLLYSGDVKIYENLDVLPRAFVVDRWTWQPDVEAAVAAMAVPTFDPARTAVLVGEGVPGGAAPASAAVEIRSYLPEEVAVHAELSADGLLLLTDALYPGWEVTVDDVAAPLYRANALFRGVLLPAGTHEVVFTFVPRSYQYGRLVSVGALLLLLVLSLWFRKGKSE